VLGKEEKCCGDSVKRLGNEYLFQMIAQENIQLFKKYGIKKIITFCPHGFNTFKNEYPLLADLLPDLSVEEKNSLKKMEIIHHTDFTARLYREGRLKIKPVDKEIFTYHDSCYLGRHNGLLNPPRTILSQALSAKLVELEDNREHSFCCGAGGGLMWTEETQGTRINHRRTEQILKKQPQTVCTSCPFCQTMLSDGLKDKEKENISVLDVAQVVASHLESK
ncbi:MAG: (Fe-S)-binding protein, partial [Acidobacteriota bacterium]